MVVSIISLLGGLGLFLYGMKLMGDGLELVAGSKLKRVLQYLTNNKFIGAFIGLVITAIIQSSSATTVMVVGFVNAGIVDLLQATSVIMGANIGTTVTGIIISLNLSTIAPLVLFIGILFMLFSKKKGLQHLGMIVAGFGILFFGMNIMSEAMIPFRTLPQIEMLFNHTKNPLFGLLVGALFTATIQSSSASMGILIAFAATGIITSLDQAIFILYGQNIGTCITTALSTIGTTKNAKRAALIHFLFNFIGTIIFTVITLIPLNYGFSDLIKHLSPDIKGQLALTHVIFNIFTTLLLLPLSRYLVRLSEKIIRGDDKNIVEFRFKHIDRRLLNTPPIAVSQTRMEVLRMTDIVYKNYCLMNTIVFSEDDNIDKYLNEANDNEQLINFLNTEITKFLVKLNTLDLSYVDTKMIGSLYKVISDLERIGDHCTTIISLKQKNIENKGSFSTAAEKELNLLTENVEKILTMAINFFDTGEYEKDQINKIKKLNEIINIQTDAYKENHIERLNNGECGLDAGINFVKILASLERISDHAYNIAKSLKYKEKK